MSHQLFALVMETSPKALPRHFYKTHLCRTPQNGIRCKGRWRACYLRHRLGHLTEPVSFPSCSRILLYLEVCMMKRKATKDLMKRWGDHSICAAEQKKERQSIDEWIPSSSHLHIIGEFYLHFYSFPPNWRNFLLLDAHRNDQ